MKKVPNVIFQDPKYCKEKLGFIHGKTKGHRRNIEFGKT